MKQQIELIIEKYYRPIYCYCTAKLYDSEAAKDCTQEVFLAFVRKAERLDVEQEIRPWLYRAADLVIRAYRRKNSQLLSISDEDLERLCETVMPEYTEDCLRELLTEEEYALVWQHYMEGQTMRTLAARCGTSEDAMKQRISRIRRRLADALKSREEGTR